MEFDGGELPAGEFTTGYYRVVGPKGVSASKARKYNVTVANDSADNTSGNEDCDADLYSYYQDLVSYWEMSLREDQADGKLLAAARDRSQISKYEGLAAKYAC